MGITRCGSGINVAHSSTPSSIKESHGHSPMWRTVALHQGALRAAVGLPMWRTPSRGVRTPSRGVSTPLRGVTRCSRGANVALSGTPSGGVTCCSRGPNVAHSCTPSRGVMRCSKSAYVAHSSTPARGVARCSRTAYVAHSSTLSRGVTRCNRRANVAPHGPSHSLSSSCSPVQDVALRPALAPGAWAAWIAAEVGCEIVAHSSPGM